MADGMQSYVLMHKNTTVADLELDEASGSIAAVGRVYAARHAPVGVAVRHGLIDRAALNEWWKGRAIPASRAGIKHALAELNLTSTQKLLEKCLGLSLSDQYWICPAGSGIRWGAVNFFQNPFSDDVGNILFGQGTASGRVSLMSPDNTSDGWLKKKWKIIDGKRCLIKGGSGATQQEPYNEVLASSVMERLGIPHVKYSLLTEDDYPYSVCEDFITPQTELIPAYRIMQTIKRPNHTSVCQHYLDCCRAAGVPGIREALDRMIVVDYLIGNEDRHQNNFGVIRDAETLEYIGPAPIFDSGASLWFDKPTAMIGSSAKLGCKPFKNSHEEQIKLVDSFDWLDLDALYGLDEEFREMVRGSLFIDGARCDALCSAIKGRVEALKAVINSRTAACLNSCEYDVAEDIAYSGPQGEEIER